MRGGAVTHTAYLVAHFRIIGGQPFFQGTCILSEGGDEYTGGIGRDRWSATVISMPGSSFAEALENLMKLPGTPYGDLYKWAFDALVER
jgi:hypothetical protein